MDVLLVIEDSGDEASYLPALKGAGYVLRVREPDFHEHRVVPDPGQGRTRLLGRAKARIKQALVEAVGRALDGITPEDARGWFGHRGYATDRSL